MESLGDPLPVETAIKNLRRTASESNDRLGDLLAQVATDPSTTEDVWEELWADLYDPGGASTADGWAVLPVLAALTRTDQVLVLFQPVALAGAIVGYPIRTSDREVMTAAYSADIAVLREAAERTLTIHLKPHEVICVVKALAAFEGLEPWGYVLEFLNAQDLAVACPSCGTHMWVDISPDGSDLEIASPDLSTLCPADARVLQLVDQHGGRWRRRITASLMRLLGTVTCPECATPYQISDALRADQQDLGD